MTYSYTVVLLREEDGRYSVSVPALKGCHTWGDNLPHSIQMVEEAMGLYRAALRDRGIPAPPDSPDVRVDMPGATEAIVCRI